MDLHDSHTVGLKTVQDLLGGIMIDCVTVTCLPMYYGQGAGVNRFSEHPLHTAFILASSKVELPNHPNVHPQIDIHGNSEDPHATCSAPEDVSDVDI